MDQNTLMLLNYIQDYKGNVYYITLLDALGDFRCSPVEIKEDVTIRNNDDFSPIPLTEEWLLKFGLPIGYEFKAWGCTTKVTHISILYGVYLVLTEKGWMIGISNEDSSHIEIQEDEVIYHYVHQLQNLYFALTGKELVINS